jgi:hypothetical protein
LAAAAGAPRFATALGATAGWASTARSSAIRTALRVSGDLGGALRAKVPWNVVRL